MIQRLVPVLFCLALVGCRHAAPPAPIKPTVPPSVSPVAPVRGDSPLPLNLSREQQTELILSSLRKRILGRREAPRDVARIVAQIGPIIAEAARQPLLDLPFQRMAQAEGVSVAEMRARWIALHEADLLLESGGSADAVSSSQAVGVSQWLAGSARANGLHVDLRESNRLTAKINPLKRRIAWAEYLLRPDADPNAPGAPTLARDQAQAQLPSWKAELETLREKRRKADSRYDPRQAIFAQTRYLIRLYPRFPSLDWLFQAYHGGEGGVTRTLKRFLDGRWISAANAIRSGRNGQPLRYEDLYFATTPRSHPAAFAYLYGRSDDHRRYWWKLRTSEEVIALYRRDPTAFQREWESLLPGRRQEAVWIPQGPREAFADLPALQAAQKEGRLMNINLRPGLKVPPADPAKCRSNALRPEAKGAVIFIAMAYRRVGGSGALEVGHTSLTLPDIAALKAQLPTLPPPTYPPDPDAQTLPGGGPPPDFNYHATGLAFDIRKPANPQQRKLLDYALGYGEDRQLLWRTDRENGDPHYHIVPNPRFRDALAAIGRTGRVPPLPGL